MRCVVLLFALLGSTTYGIDLMPGTLFRAVEPPESSIKIVSPDELEITPSGQNGAHLVCKYSHEGGSIRAVTTVMGTTQALYFKTTEQGLLSSDGIVFYDATHFADAHRAAQSREEARKMAQAAETANARLKAIANSTPSPTPISGAISFSSAKALAVYAPRPAYPYEARSLHITGSGVVALTVEVASGRVKEATMAQSIGNVTLDNAALSAFRQWRFKPRTVSQIKVPITFTMAGASH